MAECQATTKQGRVCGAHALAGSGYCFMHAPERAAERASARRLGGMRRGSHAGDTSSIPHQVKTVEGVLSLLDYVLAELAALDNGIPRARALIALAGGYLQALEVGEVEERLKALEELVNVSKK
mgnify:FL=1